MLNNSIINFKCYIHKNIVIVDSFRNLMQMLRTFILLSVFMGDAQFECPLCPVSMPVYTILYHFIPFYTNLYHFIPFLF